MSGRFLDDGFSLPCPPGLKIPEQEPYTIPANTLKTLMLLGCFAVFWTVYYTLEVFLTRNKVALDLTACSSARVCPWPTRGRAASSLEEGTEMEESLPLYAGEELEVERETEPLRAGQEGQKGPRGGQSPGRGEAC